MNNRAALMHAIRQKRFSGVDTVDDIQEPEETSEDLGLAPELDELADDGNAAGDLANELDFDDTPTVEQPLMASLDPTAALEGNALEGAGEGVIDDAEVQQYIDRARAQPAPTPGQGMSVENVFGTSPEVNPARSLRGKVMQKGMMKR